VSLVNFSNTHIELAINESIVCASCDTTWRILNLSEMSSGHVHVIVSNDHFSHVESSCCPSCAGGRQATFTRPAPTRKDLHVALDEAKSDVRELLRYLRGGRIYTTISRVTALSKKYEPES
jgi:hypothetical protein